MSPTDITKPAMFTLEESALLSRMLRFVGWLLLTIVLAAVALCVATTIIINYGKARYSWVTLLPLSFVATTTLVAGWESITDIFWPLSQKPDTAWQGYINTFLTATIMVAAVIILVDSIRRWFGFGNRPEPISNLAEAEA